MDIKGHTVEKTYADKNSEIKEEYYLSFTLDRLGKKIFNDFKRKRWNGY